MANKPPRKRTKKEVQERTAPPGQVVHEAILSRGRTRIERDTGALAWSGLAAGLSMGFSMVVQALLQVHLPDARRGSRW